MNGVKVFDMPSRSDPQIVPQAPISRRRLWFERFAYAVMISGTTIALLVLTSVIYNAYFRTPPVTVVQIDKPPPGPVCPGTPMNIRNHITVKSPAILHIVVSVMDEGTNYNVPDTSRELEPRPHPHPAVFVQDIPWIVPHLPPGKYNRTVTMRSHRSNEHPLFVHQEFEIGEHCD